MGENFYRENFEYAQICTSASNGEQKLRVLDKGLFDIVLAVLEEYGQSDGSVLESTKDGDGFNDEDLAAEETEFRISA